VPRCASNAGLASSTSTVVPSGRATRLESSSGGRRTRSTTSMFSCSGSTRRLLTSSCSRTPGQARMKAGISGVSQNCASVKGQLTRSRPCGCAVAWRTTSKASSPAAIVAWQRS
jgi:hypothetical protein